jgi:hypothetical protein
MSKLYVYKMTTDSGGAPCVSDRKLSLAICKPAIRTSAQAGDIILGFAANSLYADNCLVYVAKVSRKVEGEDYYSDAEFETRPDCIYEFRDHIYSWKSGAKYHSQADLTHDLGEPEGYARAKVLLSDDPANFRYFGSACPINYKLKYPSLGAELAKLTQGHRVNLEASVRSDVLKLLDEVWETSATPVSTSVPQEHCPTNCGEDEGDFECDC